MKTTLRSLFCILLFAFFSLELVEPAFAGCCTNCQCPYNVCFCAEKTGNYINTGQPCGYGSTIHIVEYQCNTWPFGKVYCAECLGMA